jgi:hypothetical protein
VTGADLRDFVRVYGPRDFVIGHAFVLWGMLTGDPFVAGYA